MAALLALASSLLVGGADYMASLAARRAHPETVPVLTSIASLLAIVMCLPLVSAQEVRRLDLVWGAVGGGLVALGFVLFLTAMSRGQMGVVAPITAVVGAATTVLVGLARGERPSGLSWLGMLLASAAIAVISATTGDDEGDIADHRDHRVASTPVSAVVIAIGAGLGFGSFFAALSMTEADAGLWPLVPAKLSSIPVAFAVSLVAHRHWSVHRSARALAVWAGLAEGLASVMLLEALRRGDLTVVGVLGSLYPVSTVVLASILLRERLHRRQWIGVLVALVAVPLITL